MSSMHLVTLASFQITAPQSYRGFEIEDSASR